MKRLLFAGLLVVVVAVALVAIGRLERSSASRAQVDGMREVAALVGPRWQTTAAAYRLTPAFDCLLYRVGRDPYALELCFDSKGRVVEAIDRRQRTAPRFWTLQYDPAASTFRFDPLQVAAALASVGGAPKGSTSIPLGSYDIGPQTPEQQRPEVRPVAVAQIAGAKLKSRPGSTEALTLARHG